MWSEIVRNIPGWNESESWNRSMYGPRVGLQGGAEMLSDINADEH
jgi:hypothetical protein